MWIRADVHGNFILAHGVFSCLIIASVFYFLTPVRGQGRDFKGSLVAVSLALPTYPSFSQLQSSTMNSRLSPTGDSQSLEKAGLERWLECCEAEKQGRWGFPYHFPLPSLLATSIRDLQLLTALVMEGSPFFFYSTCLVLIFCIRIF